MTFTEAIHRTIALAKELDSVTEAALERVGRTIGSLRLVRGDELPLGPPPPEWHALRQFLGELPPAHLCLTATVLYIGRGDYEAEDLLDAYVEVSDRAGKPGELADHLMGKPLARYLTDGLEALTAARVNLDKLHAG